MKKTPISIGCWTLTTSLGWLLGLPLIILLALAGEVLGLGGTQVLLGLGMGASIGFLQGRRLRVLEIGAGPWFLTCVGGLALPFLVTDLARLAGSPLPYSLPAAVVVGGFLVGSGQAYLLQRQFRSTAPWVVASLVGWSGAAGATALADILFRSHSLRGLGGALVFLGIIAAGGPFLGLVSGWALQRLQTVPRHGQQ